MTCQRNLLAVVVVILSSLTHCHHHSPMFVLFMTLVWPYLTPHCCLLCCCCLHRHFVIHMVIVLAMAFVIIVVAYKPLLWSTFIILDKAFVFVPCSLLGGHHNQFTGPSCHDTTLLVALNVTFMMVPVICSCLHCLSC